MSGGGYRAININPDPIIINEPIPESKFGDDWSQILSKKDINLCKDYFLAIEKLSLILMLE